MKTKALVILSGGQDSTTCLFWAKNHFDEVEAVTFDYNQRHNREIDSAIKIAEMAGVPHEVVSIGAILRGTSPLVSDAPLEQYPDFNALPGGLEKTFVPGRNLLFLVLAANLAYVKGIDHLITGVCQEDYGGYPDCRNDFIRAAAVALQMAMDKPFCIHVPLMFLSKSESVNLAKKYDGCLQALAYSHTGYDGAYPPTGQDHATQLRAKGFFEANTPDPLVVRAWTEGLMALPETSNYDELRRLAEKLDAKPVEGAFSEEGDK